MATQHRLPVPLARSSGSIADDIARHIERQILIGELAGGDRLPAERALAQALGVSRPALREALGRLAAAGLVVRRRGSGTRVRHDVPLSATLAARLAHDDEDPAHSAEFREAVEPQIARLAAVRISTAECDRLAEILADWVDGNDADASIRQDVAFHVGVAQASGNPLLSVLGELVVSWTVEARAHSHLGADGRRLSRDGHLRILEALRTGDADAAERAMAVHLQEVRAVIDQELGAVPRRRRRAAR